MTLRGRYFPRQIDQGLGPVLSFVVRLSWATLFTVTLVAIGAVAMLFNTAPEWLSLIFEPFSLLLLPGLVVGVASSSAHDLDPAIILDASVLFYFFLFSVLLEMRAFRRRRRRRRKNN